ncbi:hypothetical protein [Bifidobacterium leontopitheci]|uniref:Lipoprotein n=1 Tax=Bifidobacterium leontopitheci TaxID=2650774 RepID=A0A6I1GVT9_9BIFI|nr:hypothetical protein [Bifidobacterium leontopitheci]KAB7790581.1 hypothetical protein F7D09_0950 [Bifidobacterium leontopitheci]
MSSIGHPWRRMLCTLLCGAVVTLAASCGTAASTNSDSQKKHVTWAQQIKQDAKKAKTSLGKGILKDGDITAAEFSEFTSAYDACLKKHNMTVSFDSKGESYTDLGNTLTKEEGDAIIDQCRTQTDYMLIVPTYQQMQWNPDNRDGVEMVVECLKKHKLVDQSLTRQDYIDIITDESRNAKEFGKYEDPSNASYDQQKAAQYTACQTHES